MAGAERGSASLLVLGLCGLVLSALLLVGQLTSAFEAASRAESAAEAAVLAAAWVAAPHLVQSASTAMSNTSWEGQGAKEARQVAQGWAVAYRGQLSNFEIQALASSAWRLAVEVRVAAHPFLPGELAARGRAAAVIRSAPSGWDVHLEARP